MLSREEFKELFENYGDSDNIYDVLKDSIGSCVDCHNYKLGGVCSIHSEDAGADVIMMGDDFCSYFEPKETK